MRTKVIMALSLLCLVIGALGAALILNKSAEQEKSSEFTVQVNRLIIFVEQHWTELQGGDTEALRQNSPEGMEFVVIDSEGKVLFQTKDGLSVNESQATMNFDLIRDVTSDGKILGKLLIHNENRDAQAWRNERLALLFFGMSALLALCMVGYAFYLRKKVIQPFEQMEGFARQVAMGNLDMPLEMDRENVFGAFTQSFDLMREELKASRLREEAAVNSRKELIAQLSHDIKTPVASIKAMAEVMELSTEDAEQKQTMQAINAKADQIDRLISNLFHATLEELEHLEVHMEEVSTDEIQRMLQEADHRHLVTQAEIPEGVVRMDSLRLSQVIGNIISNSYKYANTEIQVKGSFEKLAEIEYLALEFCDHGGGVPEEELPLIVEKFKRGSNSAGKDGAGLGLYLSSYLMKKMEGSLSCKNQDDGFAVILRLPLA